MAVSRRSFSTGTIASISVQSAVTLSLWMGASRSVCQRCVDCSTTLTMLQSDSQSVRNMRLRLSNLLGLAECNEMYWDARSHPSDSLVVGVVASQVALPIWERSCDLFVDRPDTAQLPLPYGYTAALLLLDFAATIGTIGVWSLAQFTVLSLHTSVPFVY